MDLKAQEASTNHSDFFNWTSKFSNALKRLQNTVLQKISASDDGELILSVYKPKDDRSHVVLSIKKGASGIFLTSTKPQSQKQPNSFVQIARKYLDGRHEVPFTYLTISPCCVIVELGEFCFILDLDSKPSRIIFAKKYTSVPSRYELQCAPNFSSIDTFFESYCEWSVEHTKTKKRASFEYPLIGFCPFSFEEKKNVTSLEEKKVVSVEKSSVPLTKEQAFTILPIHIRKKAKTRLQFLERRLVRQRDDLPKEAEIIRLQKQSEGLKANIYLWPKDSPTWIVPFELTQEYSLDSTYTLKKHEKTGDLLNSIHHEIYVLKRRIQELTVRIAESTRAKEDFLKLIFQAALEFSQNNFVINTHKLPLLSTLCNILEIPMIQTKETKKIEEEERRLPYKSYKASSGEFIRVARSAIDGDAMIKLMPSNHTWLHVLNGEGSHVWLEKPKGKRPSTTAQKEACILAIHHSKQSRSQQADVQIATRADIEKRKNLPPGKVLVRRCDTLLIKYNNDDLQGIIKGEK